MKKLLLALILIQTSSIATGQTWDSVGKAYLDINAPKYTDDSGSGILSQSDLFNEVAPSGYDLLNANLTFTDKDQVQKIGFSPMKLYPKYYLLLSNLRISFTNKSGALTGGLSIGNDNSAYESRRVKKLYNDLSTAAAALPAIPARRVSTAGVSEPLADYNNRLAKDTTYTKKLKQIADKFEDDRLLYVIKYAFGYNAQFFPVLESKSSNSNYDSINYHGFKGHNLFLNGSFSYKNGCITTEAAINYFNKRKASDSIQVKNEYHGISFAVTKRIFTLMSQDKLDKKDFFINSRFIPSIYLGVSYEHSEYKGNNYIYAEDNAKKTTVYTPYLDVRITPAVQFRLAIPIKNIDEYVSDTDGKQIGAVLSFNYKLINLSN